MDYTLLIMGILALSIGIFLWYWIGKRQFNRRNFARLEGFKSYEKAVLIRTFERIGKFLAFILILAGALFLLGYSLQKKKVEPILIEKQLPSKK